MNGSVSDRLWPKVDRSGGPDACWTWLACRRSGYGLFWVGGKGLQAHRVAYELLVGPIPEGLSIDHLCRNTGCVNPAHLEPVTHKENVLRGVGQMAVNARKTHCLRGHLFDEENTYVAKANYRRLCRECRRMHQMERRARQREVMS